MSEDLTPLEAALTGLSPVPPRLDRDALMYAAGRAAARRTWLWPAVAASFALVSIGLGGRRVTFEPRIGERVVYIREPDPEPVPYSGYQADAGRYDNLMR